MAASVENRGFEDFPSKIAVCLEDSDPNAAGKALNDLSVDIADGKIKIVQLIEALASYLTNENKDERRNGITLLSAVLHRLHNSARLSEKEVKQLSKFFCDRMNDHYSILPAVLCGLNALSFSENICDADVLLIIQNVFQHVQTQSLMQADRKAVFQMLQNLLKSKLNTVLTMGADFVCGYVQMLDGEKDPRNLLIAFDTVPLIIEHFPIDTFAEELFEVTACYFPIDFTPPPDKFGTGVKRAQLVGGLQKCMSASPLFAEFCLPLLLEKLNSEIDSSKLAALNTFVSALEKYTPKHLIEFENSIWSSLNHELFMGSNSEIELAALNALGAVVRVLQKHESNGDGGGGGDGDDVLRFCKLVMRDCKRYFYEPDMKLMISSGLVLKTLAANSIVAARFIYDETIPILLEQFQKHCAVNSRVHILEVLKSYAEAGSECSNINSDHPFMPFSDEICVLFLSLISDGSHTLRCKALQGCCSVMPFAGERITTILDSLSLLTVTDPIELVREEGLKCLQNIQRDYIELVAEFVVPKLLVYLKDATNTDDIEPANYYVPKDNLTLSTVMKAIVVVNTGNVKIAEVSFTNIHLRMMLSIKNKQLADTVVLLEGMVKILKENRNENELLTLCFEIILKELVQSLPTTYTIETRGDDVTVLEQTTTLVLYTMNKLSPHLTLPYVSDLLTSFVGNSPDMTNNSMGNIHVSLVLAAVSSLPRNVNVPHFNSLVSKLETNAIQSDDKEIRLSSCKFLAQLVNKMEKEDNENSFIDGITSRLRNELTKERVFILWSWLSKALVIRAHPSYKIFLDEIISAFDSDLGALAANAIKIILTDYEDVLNVNTHSNIRLMYRQRLFVETLPRLVQGFNRADKGQKSYYLTAVSHLLGNVPKQVVLGELPPLLPLMIQSLQSDNVDLWSSTLTTIDNLFTDAPDLLKSYIDSLIPQFLNLSRFEHNMQVRIKALHCLGSVCTLTTHVLIPYQKKVLKDTKPQLDDRKRLVRREAAYARCQWSEL